MNTENKIFHTEIRNEQTVAWLEKAGEKNPVLFYLYCIHVATRNGSVPHYIFSATPPDQLSSTERYRKKPAKVELSKVILRGGDFHVNSD